MKYNIEQKLTPLETNKKTLLRLSYRVLLGIDTS